MNSFELQLAAGIVIAIISFILGYLLFLSQTHEQKKLEVFRRRLDLYKEITEFIEELDIFAHNIEHGKILDRSELAEVGRFCIKVRYFLGSATIYAPLPICSELQLLIQHIPDLPGSIGAIEETSTRINHKIGGEVGEYFDNWATSTSKKIGNKGEKELLADPFSD